MVNGFYYESGKVQTKGKFNENGQELEHGDTTTKMVLKSNFKIL